MTGKVSQNIVNKDLWIKIRNEAKIKFENYPSAYASFWISKEYKKRGGTFFNQQKNNNLTRWKDEKWVNVCETDANGNYLPCGRQKKEHDYPLCRPTVKVNKNTPKTVWELDPQEIKNNCKSRYFLKPDYKYNW